VFSPVQPSFDLSSRIEALVGLGSGVFLFDYSELYRMTSFINRYTGSGAFCCWSFFRDPFVLFMPRQPQRPIT
jgi:hypothetical protein